jgi:hypothetical protein
MSSYPVHLQPETIRQLKQIANESTDRVTRALDMLTVAVNRLSEAHASEASGPDDEPEHPGTPEWGEVLSALADVNQDAHGDVARLIDVLSAYVEATGHREPEVVAISDADVPPEPWVARSGHIDGFHAHLDRDRNLRWVNPPALADVPVGWRPLFAGREVQP